MDAAVILALQTLSAQTMQPSEADQSSPCPPQKGRWVGNCHSSSRDKVPGGGRTLTHWDAALQQQGKEPRGQ